MPYRVRYIPSVDGYKVCKVHPKDGSPKCFSHIGLSKEDAIKQRKAIAISESKRTGKPVSHYFV